MMTREELQQAVKDGLKEWLDERFALVGKWTTRGVVAMLLAVVVYLFLKQSGWTPGVQ